jgi:hypothetical protein
MSWWYLVGMTMMSWVYLVDRIAMLLARGTYEPMDHMNMVSPRAM